MIYKVPEEYPTLQAAVAAASGVPGERVIEICGKQRLSAPLMLDNSVQGAASGALRFVGADASAAICGSVALTGFADAGAYKGGHLFTLDLPQTERTRHLYMDGISLPRPRTEQLKPSAWEQLAREDYYFADPKGEYTPRPGLTNKVYGCIGTTHTETLGWRNIADVEMVFETGWTHCIVPLRAAEAQSDGTVWLIPEPHSFRTCHTRGSVPTGGCPNWFENVFEAIKPGEWYFDRTEKRLYLLLPEGDTPDAHEIELPLTEKLLVAEGTLGHKLRNISFEHLTFCNTTYNAPALRGHAEMQANITQDSSETDAYGGWVTRKTPSSICVRAAMQVYFTECTFTALGSGAIDFEFGAEDCGASRCEFAQIAGSAVVAGDFTLPDSHPSDKRETVRAIEIRHCHIHHTGLDYRGSVAVIAGYVQDLQVVHNHIHDVPYSAVSVGWGWGQADLAGRQHLSYPTKNEAFFWTEPSVCKRNHVDYNHIHHAMQRLHDGGAIYTLGCMEGSTIIGNDIHDSAGYTGDGYHKFAVADCENASDASAQTRRWRITGMAVGGLGVERDEVLIPYTQQQGFPGGIYMDEGSSGIEVRDNVLAHVAVPIFYHNQIPDGWKTILLGFNTLLT